MINFNGERKVMDKNKKKEKKNSLIQTETQPKTFSVISID